MMEEWAHEETALYSSFLEKQGKVELQRLKMSLNENATDCSALLMLLEETGRHDEI